MSHTKLHFPLFTPAKLTYIQNDHLTSKYQHMYLWSLNCFWYIFKSVHIRSEWTNATLLLFLFHLSLVLFPYNVLLPFKPNSSFLRFPSTLHIALKNWWSVLPDLSLDKEQIGSSLQGWRSIKLNIDDNNNLIMMVGVGRERNYY